VGPRPGLDAVVKREKSHHSSYQELNRGRPASSLVSLLPELPGLLVPLNLIILGILRNEISKVCLAIFNNFIYRPITFHFCV
jgi:hypothetical protein